MLEFNVITFPILYKKIKPGHEKPAPIQKNGFSTKVHDRLSEDGDGSDLIYYGYRHYSPRLGRFISKDPIEEAGGMNLYAMAWNDAVNKMDVLGLYDPVITPYADPNYSPPTPPMPDGMSTSKFIWWYNYKNGATYDAIAEGELDDCKCILNPILRKIDDKAWDAIKQEAKRLCDANDPAWHDMKEHTAHFSLRGQKETGNVTSRLFWVGDTTVFWGLEGDITVHCCAGYYSYSGPLKYSWRDAGEDPLDIGIETGTPYKIVADWEDDYSYATGVIP